MQPIHPGWILVTPPRPALQQNHGNIYHGFESLHITNRDCGEWKKKKKIRTNGTDDVGFHEFDWNLSIILLGCKNCYAAKFSTHNYLRKWFRSAKQKAASVVRRRKKKNQIGCTDGEQTCWVAYTIHTFRCDVIICQSHYLVTSLPFRAVKDWECTRRTNAKKGKEKKKSDENFLK